MTSICALVHPTEKAIFNTGSFLTVKAAEEQHKTNKNKVTKLLT